MTIDLTKLSGVLKTLGDLSNIETPNDTELKGKEESIFKDYADNALKSGSISESEYSAIFGLEKSNAASQTNSTTTTPVELSRFERKEVQKNIKKQLKALIASGVTPNELYTALNNKLSGSMYNGYLAEVKTIIDKVNSYEYNSKEDIEGKYEYQHAGDYYKKVEDGIFDKVEDSIKESKDFKWKDFHDDILGMLKEQATALQIGKEFNTLKNKYIEVKKTMANTEIVKEKGDNYKAYVEIIKDEVLEKGSYWKNSYDNSYTKEAVKLLEDYAKQDAEALTEIRFRKMKKTTSADDMLNELKALNKGEDKYQEEAISDLKKDAEAFARKANIDKRAIDLKHVNKQDIINAFYSGEFSQGPEGAKFLNKEYKDCKRLFIKLSPYFEKFQDGDSYDLSKLSDEMLSRIGIDYQVNYSSDKKMAEIKNIENKLEGEINIDLSTKEVEKLMKLCKVVKQEKDRTFKTAINDALSGIPEMLTGAITGLATSRTLNVNQTVRIPFDDYKTAKETYEAMIALGYKPELSKLDNGGLIEVKQNVFINNSVLNTLTGIGIGILTNTLMSMAFGKVTEEDSCISIADYDINNPTYTNVEQYKEYIARNNKNPEKVNAIKTLADVYYKQYGDDWHVHYHQALRDMAGIGSKLNPDECRMMKYPTPAVDKTGEPDKMPAKAKQDKRPAESSPVRDCVDENCEASLKDNTFTYTRQGGDSWTELVRAFYPCLEKDYGMGGKNGAIRRLKKALSYNEDGSFNQKTYEALLQGGDLPKTMKLPEKIDGCNRVDNAKVKKVTISGNGKAKIQSVGFGYWTATDGCDEQEAKGKTKQEALEKLKEKTGKKYTNEAELLK